MYQAFLSVAEKKGSISLKELDALIAAEAMQVPPAYQVIRFVVNTGNEIGAMAHMKLTTRIRNSRGYPPATASLTLPSLRLRKR